MKKFNMLGSHQMLIALLLILGAQHDVFSQQSKNAKDLIELTEENLVGTRLPQHTFTRVKNYSSQFGADIVPLEDLRGKWLILYFWTRSCIPCIESFSELKEIESQTGDELRVMLVGINDMWNRNTEAFYDGVKAAQKFALPIAYDTTLVKKLKIIYSGTALLVNPDGIVEYVCSGKELSSKGTKAFIRRRSKSAQGL